MLLDCISSIQPAEDADLPGWFPAEAMKSLQKLSRVCEKERAQVCLTCVSGIMCGFNSSVSDQTRTHVRTHVQAGWFRDDLTVGGALTRATVVKASSRRSPGSQHANQLAQKELTFPPCTVLISTSIRAEVEVKLSAGGLIGSSFWEASEVRKH